MRLKHFQTLFFALRHILFSLILVLGLSSCNQTRPQTDIWVSLKPIHSVVLALTQSTSINVSLLGGGIRSPHHYALKPSDMQQLHTAKVIIQISPDLERFLVKPLSTLSKDQQIISLIKVAGLTLLPSNSEHKDHDDEIDHHSANQDKTNSPATPDLHIWLDPQNMKLMTTHLKDQLIKAFPNQSFLIKQNARQLNDQLTQLDDKIKTLLSTVKNEKFMVYHNAFQYFEHRYDLHNLGSFLNGHALLGSRHAVKMKKQMQAQNIRCLFTMSGKQPPFVKVLTQDTQIKAVPLSALGTSRKPSPALFFEMMEQLAIDYKNCLSITKP